MPFLIGVSGYKNSGKTTLCRKLAACLTSDGVTVGYIKRTHEPVLPTGINDTNSLAEWTGRTVLWGPDGFVLFCPQEKANIQEIAAESFAYRDIVIVEGGKHLPMPKIWVKDVRHEDEIPGIVARYDPTEDAEGIPCFGRGEEKDLAGFIKGLWIKSDPGPVELYADGRNVPVKKFVGEFIAGGIRGMLSTLKNPPGKREKLRIFVRPEEEADRS